MANSKAYNRLRIGSILLPGENGHPSFEILSLSDGLPLVKGSPRGTVEKRRSENPFRYRKRLDRRWVGVRISDIRKGLTMTDSYSPKEADLRWRNADIVVDKLARQLRRQDSGLLLVEAHREARRLAARGVRDLFE
jgi:hypothetical protein